MMTKEQTIMQLIDTFHARVSWIPQFNKIVSKDFLYRFIANAGNGVNRDNAKMIYGVELSYTFYMGCHILSAYYQGFKISERLSESDYIEMPKRNFFDKALDWIEGKIGKDYSQNN